MILPQIRQANVIFDLNTVFVIICQIEILVRHFVITIFSEIQGENVISQKKLQFEVKLENDSSWE